MRKEIILPELHEAQELVRSEAQRFNVLDCGRRWGKSVFGGNLLSETALDGYPSGYFTPTYKLLEGTYREVLNNLEPLVKRKHDNQFIELQTGGIIEFWTLDNPFAGRSRKYKRVVVDEAAFAKMLLDRWNNAIRPTLTDLIGDAWLMSTPRGKNDFYKLYMRGISGEKHWKSWQMPTSTNPYISKSEIEDAKRDLPEIAFSQEYLAAFSDNAANPFGGAHIVNCVRPISTNTPVSFGIDLAKSHDWTVVTGLDEYGNVCLFERWQSDWAQTRSRIIKIVGYTPAYIDSTGVGDPIAEDIQRECAQVESFHFTSTSKQQIMEGLAHAIQNGKISVLSGIMQDELESFEYIYGRTGVKYCVSLNTMILRSDLKWVQADSLNENDELVAFDEFPEKGNKSRSWRKSKIISKTIINRPSYKITLDNDDTLISSEDHLWLVFASGEFVWKRTDELRGKNKSKSPRFSEHRLVKLLDTWNDIDSYEAGYISGMFDGEGHFQNTDRKDHKGYNFRLGLSQRKNEAFNYLIKWLKIYDFDFSISKNGSGKNKDVYSINMTGSRNNALEFLGQIRPKRLLKKFNPDRLGTLTMKESPSIKKIEFIGNVDVIAFETSTRTFIANGYASHNCAPDGLHDDCVCSLALAYHKFKHAPQVTLNAGFY